MGDLLERTIATGGQRPAYLHAISGRCFRPGAAAGRLEERALAHLAEVEGLAVATRSAIRSRTRAIIVIEHLLKVRNLPALDPRRGWRRTPGRSGRTARQPRPLSGPRWQVTVRTSSPAPAAAGGGPRAEEQQRDYAGLPINLDLDVDRARCSDGEACRSSGQRSGQSRI